MGDKALQTILADPELQIWPQRGPTDSADTTGKELPLAAFSPPRNAELPTAPEQPALAAGEIAAAPLTAPDPSSDRAAAAAAEPLITPTATATAAGRAALAEGNRDDPCDQPPDNTPADAQETEYRDSEPPAPNSAAAPLAFDEITRPRRPLADKFSDAGQWMKDNWRRPQILGSAAAAIVTAVTVSVWMASASDTGQQPTATLTAPTAAAAPAPAAAPVPGDGPIPVTTASARCPAPSSDPMNAVRPESTQPWICVRAWGIDGQVLTLTLDGPYVISAVRIMPGVNAETDGQDQWLKYRTLSRVSWSFNDVGQTKIRQSTDSRRELLTQAVSPSDCPAGGCQLVASQVVLTVEKTTAPASAPTGSGLGPVSSARGEQSSAFGVSRIEIIGHRLS